MVNLAILYTPDDGTPLRVASVNDRGLLTRAARVAIAEAEDRAEAAGEVDALLGEAQRVELERIRLLMDLFVPELRGTSR